MITKFILIPVLLPFIAAAAVAATPNKYKGAKELLALLATAANFLAAVFLFGKEASLVAPWAGLGLEFSLRLYHFSAFIILAVAGFGFLITLYSAAFMKDRAHAKQFYAYLLLSLGLAGGAVLSDNLVAMLFFWEALLITLFVMIAIGKEGAFHAATKAFIIVGISDLCMMTGIALAGHLSGTLAISRISLTTNGLGGLAFILLVIGAIAKAGSMPFHSWIPDSATNAPLPFMAILPAALEKLLGIYFLTRISLDMFSIGEHSWASFTLMTVGAITILGAVMMALIQKDYKRLLSYHAISQVGYMVLGIGTMVPVGIVGGLFHMINNALYKSCLFLTGGSVEKQAGTTDLARLGGLGKRMPVTFACFIVVAASISGVPPFNGFFSKELLYDGALERGMIFYVAAALGSFLTAASFLKLGHAAFFGKPSKETENVKEAPLAMMIPMVAISLVCVVFGVWNALPLERFIQPILGARLEGHNFAGWPANTPIVVVTVLIILAAVLNHLYGFRKYGSGIKAVDHIHHAPGLRTVYDKAEKGYLDPYNIGMGITLAFANTAAWCDKSINWVYDSLSPKAAEACSGVIRRLHDGSYKTYMIWSIAATAIVVACLLKHY
jgi:NADH-quinone oxidoreductase subunit L